MASVAHNRKNDTRMILFYDREGERQRFRLGKMDKRRAEVAKTHVEDLVECSKTGDSPSRASSEWLARLSPVLRERLERTGLIEPEHRRERLRLGQWLERYMAARKGTVKPRTEENCEQARKNLLACFGADKPLTNFTTGDGAEFRQYLARKKLAEATIRRRCGRARQFFKAAVKRGLVNVNPFEDVPCRSVADPSRLHYVTVDEVEKVLAGCLDIEWRLIFALARYGGLRTPSETLGLRWNDIDWEHGRIHVRSPKTEHIPGHESRVIPLFTELQPILQEAFDLAEPGTVHVITKYRDIKRANLRTQMERIIRAAGVTVWPKIFQNCRSTRQTEITKEYGAKTACMWLGNSERVSMDHYLQVRDEDFDRANGKAAQKAARFTTELERTEGKGDREASHCGPIHKETAPCVSTGPSHAPLRGVEPRSPG